MFKNYFRIAIRNLWKQKIFSAINILGLALGLTCSLLIFLWVQDERNMDSFHRNGKQLFYIYERNTLGGKIETWYWTQGPLAEELKKKIPEIVAATAISWPRDRTFSVGEKTLKQNGYSAGPDFFSMFSYPLIEGSPLDALRTPQSICISRKMAEDFFGSPAAAIGKTIRYENKKDFTIKAVFENPSAQVSEKFNYVISWSAFVEEESWAKDWESVDPRTCILIRNDANPQQVEKKIKFFLDGFNTELKGKNRIELGLQPFDQQYLYSEFKNGYPAGGRVEYVRLFSLVALFILVIACINFMNLTTAGSIKRAKEIGVRKVMGAFRSLLIRQFIGEAILLTGIAVVLAILLTRLTLPAFNQLTGKDLDMPLNRPIFWFEIGGISLITGLVAGSYPAFFLSAFNPIQVLKGTVKTGSAAVFFRKFLVVFQFVLSIVLIIATLLISRQIHFVQTANIGYNRENLVYLPIEGTLSDKLEVFNSEAAKISGVLQVSEFSENPTEMNNGTLSIEWQGKDPNEHLRFIHDAVGRHFLETMKMQLVEGRSFPDDGTYDSLSCLLNETAVAVMDLKKPIGKTVFEGGTPLTVIGVIKDFHFRSLHDPIQPLILVMGKKGWFSNILLRIEAGKTKIALDHLKNLYHHLNPAFPFTYLFSDEEYTKLYKSDEVTARLSLIFAGLAIIISSLGLLGLSIFTASQRIKEIGIRKVLGASLFSLFTLLSKEFMKLVVLSILVAIPLGWWAMDRWLENFAYRVPIPWWVFALAGLLAVFVAMATICMQAMRSARANPVVSLRTE